MLKITKDRGEWLKNATTLHNYAYQLFLNDYERYDSLMSQDRFIELTKDLGITTINQKNISDYYKKATFMIRKDKLENIC